MKLQIRKKITRAKAQRTPSAVKKENIFLCELGVLARKILLKLFC